MDNKEDRTFEPDEIINWLESRLLANLPKGIALNKATCTELIYSLTKSKLESSKMLEELMANIKSNPTKYFKNNDQKMINSIKSSAPYAPANLKYTINFIK